MRIGFVALTDAAPVVMAQALGLYAERGLRVELVKQASWPAVRDALLAGDLDAAHCLSSLPFSVAAGVTGTADQLLPIVMILNANGQAVTLAAAMADDRYDTPAANLQAIHHIIEARRVELRHGTLALVRATFAGFKALPAPAASDWWTVLGVEQTASLEEARAAYRRAASAAHPDRGGTDARMAEVNRAWEQAQEAQR